MEEDLKRTKSKLDDPYKNKKAYKIFRVFEPFSKVKNQIATRARNYNITNAWIKCYELIHHFKLIPSKQQTEITHFANAELPGSFICAIHHYINTMTQCRYRWIASSMIGDNMLEDSYALHRNFPKRWLMDKDCNGDMSECKTVMAIGDTAYNYNLGNGKGVYLYTSDLGFGVSEDYNNQENLHLKANIGQILCGVVCLKEGGCMITKQYTYFNPTNVSIIGGLTMIFQEVYISKPMSSKKDNSEVYIVCRGLKRNKFYASFVNFMRDMLEPPKKITHPSMAIVGEIAEQLSSAGIDTATVDDIKKYAKTLKKFPRTFLKARELTPEFIDAINSSTRVIFQAQIAKINLDIATYYEVEKMPIAHAEAEAIRKYGHYRKYILKNFFQDNPIRPIHSKMRLKMKDKYRQRK